MYFITCFFPSTFKCATKIKKKTFILSFVAPPSCKYSAAIIVFDIFYKTTLTQFIFDIRYFLLFTAMFQIENLTLQIKKNRFAFSFTERKTDARFSFLSTLHYKQTTILAKIYETNFNVTVK